MISRRKFLTSSAALGAGLALAPKDLKSFVEESSRPSTVAETVITILHTNDTHSQIDPLPDNDKSYAGKGGVARRATLVKRIRKENPNTLLLDGGDSFQGTPYFNFYKGEVEYKSMSAIGYDAGTLGNHEFDNGVEALAAALKFATFDIVSSNYDVKGTPLETFVKPYTVKTIAGIRIGLFGLGISPVALITPANFQGVTYRDPIDTSRAMVKTLRDTERCTFIVAMSHLGFYKNPRPRDVGDGQVAAQVDGIDFIVSGHTHTFMEQPERVKQPCGQETLIYQVGRSGIYLGRVDFTFRAGKLASARSRILDLREING
jgi:5'-nucleotidase